MRDRAEGERVLVLAPLGRDAEVLCRLLVGEGLMAEACRDAGDLASRLRDGAGALLLTEEALAAGADELGRALEDQPPWSDLPVLLLDGGEQSGHGLPNVTVLPRPARALTVLSAVRAALGARRRQYEVRDLLDQLREARDELEQRVRERTAELVRTQERALQAERLAAIGQTVTALAHEGRNALQRAQAGLGRLGLRLEGSSEEQALVGRTRQALDDLGRLFDDVRGYAAPIRLDRKPCDLAKVWREAWGQVASRYASRDAQLEEDAAGLSAECEADSFRMGQVFTNLFANALEACPDPVRVVISCREVSLGEGSVLQLSVRDNGPGFPPQQRQCAFEPFLTTKSMGTGLGLAIAKRIVEGHGGRIAIGEGAGPGAEVLITLPCKKR